MYPRRGYIDGLPVGTQLSDLRFVLMSIDARDVIDGYC